MKTNLLITIFLGIFLVSTLMAAQDFLGEVTQGECISLIQICGDCTYNNISKVYYPGMNLSIALEDVAMEKDDTNYNYTFCSTQELGRYTVNGYGDEGGVKSTWNYYFEVTTGSKNIIPIFLLIFSVALLVIGIVIKSPPVGFFSGVLFIMVGMYLMIYGFGNVADLYTRAFALIVLCFGIFMTILAGFSWLDEED